MDAPFSLEGSVPDRSKESSLRFWSSQGFVPRLSLQNSSKYMSSGAFQGKEFLQNCAMRSLEGNIFLHSFRMGHSFRMKEMPLFSIDPRPHPQAE